MIRRLCVVAVGLALSACAPKVYDDPLAAMLNRELGSDQRLAAARQAAQQLPADPRRLAALNQLVFDFGHPGELRRYAVDELLACDQARFRTDLGRRIILIRNPETIEYLFRLAVERQWTDFTVAAVRRYSVRLPGVSDGQRPERGLIEKLNPGKTVEQTTFEVFANADGALDVDQQVAAWELLNRLCSRPQVLECLVRAPNRSALVVDLKAAAAELGIVPANEKAVRWLYYLRDPARRTVWQAARAKVARLGPEQSRGLELRHLPAILAADDRDLALDRATLHRQLSETLAAAEHHAIELSFTGGDKVHPQTLGAWAGDLAWADLLALRLLLRVLADRAVVAELFAQADQDQADRATEYGGLIEYAEGRFAATAFPPVVRQHDAKFIPPPEMIERSHLALAHYHFHAQEFANHEKAGPGRGDLANADGWPMGFLVFTFVGRDRLNVDYYHHGRVVIDLGTIRR